MKYFVTGGAGFVGSNLVDRLLKDGHEVVVYDNFSTGHLEFLTNPMKFIPMNLEIIHDDTLDLDSLTKAMSGCDFVFHLAANADVRHGTEHPKKDLEQNTIATFNVLEAMRCTGVKKIMFASTGSVYGEATVIPTPEDAPFPVQTSLYGASKLACEGFISAYCEGFGFQSWIYRFVSILGERYNHGHVKDFVSQLIKHPDVLKVLGDGHQKKSYLHVSDCIDGIMMGIEKSQQKVNILNLGTDEWCEVNQSIRWICDQLEVTPKIIYSDGRQGWAGDQNIFLDTTRIRELGWKPKLNIHESVIKTVEYLKKNKWIIE